MDDYESTKSLATSKERLETIMEIQPKDTSRGHFYVSLIKSVLRIGAGTSLIMMGLPEAGWLLIVAEALGILEEIV
jgi:hypothetical protein